MEGATPKVLQESRDKRAARVLNMVMLGAIVTAVLALGGWVVWANLVGFSEAYEGRPPLIFGVMLLALGVIIGLRMLGSGLRSIPRRPSK
jgi:hypothetical protein